MAAVPEIDQICEILTCIGFTDVIHRNNIRHDDFTTFSDILSTTEKDITALTEAFSRRTKETGKIHFRIQKRNPLID